MRAFETKPSPTLALGSFKRVCNEPKDHSWAPSTLCRASFAKHWRFASVTPAQANRPLLTGRSSTQTLGSLVPKEGAAIHRMRNIRTRNSELERSFRHFFTVSNSEESTQVLSSRIVTTPTPPSGNTAESEDWLPSCMKQRSPVPWAESDNLFDMDANQIS